MSRSRSSDVFGTRSDVCLVRGKSVGSCSPVSLVGLNVAPQTAQESLAFMPRCLALGTSPRVSRQVCMAVLGHVVGEE